MPDATIRAAQYLRMSTEHQTYSMANQAAAIAAYAAGRGYEIVRTYADAGISGLTLKARAGLKALLADVLGGGADFTAILVLDVSRWGRFQDPDQGAHYEFLCRQAGVSVDYCAEPFAGDGSLSSTLMKHLKRAMAAEFSRELSAKVTAGKRRLAAEGYWVGGPPGYGLQRRVIGRDGTLGHVLKAGERKSIQTDRVVLVPGPAEEVETVRRIFRLFVVGGLSRPEIARTLRREGTLAEGGASWSPWRVRQVLTNEKYVGANVYGRVSTRLGSACRVQPPQLRVRTPGAFEPTVSRRLFDDARRHIEGRGIRRTDEQLLEKLRAILAEHGRLTADLIAATPQAACPAVYRQRFGSLVSAYERVGFEPPGKQRLLALVRHGRSPNTRLRAADAFSDEAMLRQLRGILAREGRLSVQLINDAPEILGADAYRRRFGGMRRVYALVGYAPDASQDHALDHRGGQTVTAAQARELRSRIADAPPTPDASAASTGDYFTRVQAPATMDSCTPTKPL